MSDAEWLFDKIATVLRSWKLVALGAVTLTSAAILVLFLAFKPTYTARMIVPLSPEVRALISAGAIGSNLSVSDELAPGTKLFVASVTDLNPDVARSGLEKAFEQIISASKPSHSVRQRTLAEIEASKRAISELQEFKKSVSLPFSIISEIEALEMKVERLQSMLEGIKREDVPQPPSGAIEGPGALSARKVLLIFGVSLGLMALFVLTQPAVKRYRTRLAEIIP